MNLDNVPYSTYEFAGSKFESFFAKMDNLELTQQAVLAQNMDRTIS